MEIVDYSKRKNERNVRAEVVLRLEEFEKLVGSFESVSVIPNNLESKKSAYIKTGKRHTAAKYLLFPASLRKKYTTGVYDFEEITCQILEDGNKLNIIFSLPRKLSFESVANEAATESPQEESCLA